MSTIIPAQPGFFVGFPDGDLAPVIAWEIIYCSETCNFDVCPITPRGAVCGTITYLRGDGSTVWWRDRPVRQG